MQRQNTFEINFIPHDAQKEILKDTHRFRVVNSGRRFGKSLLGAAEIFRYCLKNPVDKTPNIAWIAPQYSTGDRGIEALAQLDPTYRIHKKKGNRPAIVDIITGHRIHYLSADHPDAIRGFGFCFVVIDEADFIADSTWRDIIRPTLSDNKAHGIFISTPRRKHSWYHKMFLAGQQEHPYIKSFHFPSSANPHIDKEEIKNAELELPAMSFRQEYLAIYSEDGGDVFINVDKCKVDSVCNCGESITILGIDLAKAKDFTVLTALCPICMHLKEIYRSNAIDWNIQKDILFSKWQRYSEHGPTYCVLDASGVGDVVLDNLRNAGMEIIPFKFSNPSKNKLICDLRSKIATGELKFPNTLDNVDQLVKELEGYEMSISATGTITYGNGLGILHDDCVISLALAVHGLTHYWVPITNANSLMAQSNINEPKGAQPCNQFDEFFNVENGSIWAGL